MDSGWVQRCLDIDETLLLVGRMRPSPSEEALMHIPDKYRASYTELRKFDKAVHLKERCPGCGLWRSKGCKCAHCSSHPTRAQAHSAQARQAAIEARWHAQLAARAKAGKGPRVVQCAPGKVTRGSMLTEARLQRAPVVPSHPKTKCMGCGLWVAKDVPCHFCKSRPNRMQAAWAQNRMRSQNRQAQRSAAVDRAFDRAFDKAFDAVTNLSLDDDSADGSDLPSTPAGIFRFAAQRPNSAPNLVQQISNRTPNRRTPPAPYGS